MKNNQIFSSIEQAIRNKESSNKVFRRDALQSERLVTSESTMSNLEKITLKIEFHYPHVRDRCHLLGCFYKTTFETCALGQESKVRLETVKKEERFACSQLN